MATLTTLIGLLWAAHYGWRQELIAQSAREIVDCARELHRDMGRFKGTARQGRSPARLRRRCLQRGGRLSTCGSRRICRPGYGCAQGATSAPPYSDAPWRRKHVALDRPQTPVVAYSEKSGFEPVVRPERRHPRRISGRRPFKIARRMRLERWKDPRRNRRQVSGR
jgi:hypothetical protein